MAELKVTVTVNSDDLLDVLAWHEGSDLGWDDWKPQPSNDRWLAAYQDADGARREELFSLMPASLQWAVHEVEHRGADPLRDALDKMLIACRPLTDTYVVCNRLLDAETNEHCEFDGPVNVVNGTWWCPACRGRRYHHPAFERTESVGVQTLEIEIELPNFPDAGHVGLERGLPELGDGDTQLGSDITGFPGESGIHLEPDHMLGHEPQPTHEENDHA